jgi:hypothetical protein
MIIGKLLTWFSRTVFWAIAIVLISNTSSAIRERSGDIAYILNAVFLLFGGVSIGRMVSKWIDRQFIGNKKSD